MTADRRRHFEKPHSGSVKYKDGDSRLGAEETEAVCSVSLSARHWRGSWPSLQGLSLVCSMKCFWVNASVFRSLGGICRA